MRLCGTYFRTSRCRVDDEVAAPLSQRECVATSGSPRVSARREGEARKWIDTTDTTRQVIKAGIPELLTLSSVQPVGMRSVCSQNLAPLPRSG